MLQKGSHQNRVRLYGVYFFPLSNLQLNYLSKACAQQLVVPE